MFPRWILLLCLVSAVSCGWQLRGYEQYKLKGQQNITAINLKTTSNNRDFQAALKQQLNDMSVEIDQEAAHTLVLRDERVERRPLSYGSTGIPIQYQLIMMISFGHASEKGQVLTEQTLTARRQYDFDTELIIAKDEEERQLLKEMRQELVRRIIANIHKQS